MNVNDKFYLVGLPDFDPNQRKEISNDIFINRATKGVMNLGQYLKRSLAAALMKKLFNQILNF